MSLGVSIETYLRCCWDVQGDVVMASPGCLVVGWVNSGKKKIIIIIKILKLELVILLEYQIIKIFSEKVTLETCLKTFL